MRSYAPHLALLFCNVIWAMDYPFYNLVLSHYVTPMAMVSASLAAAALFSLIPLLWEKAEKIDKADVRKLIGAALLVGVLRKVFLMYGLARTSPIDGSIISTIGPLLVLILSVALGIDHFTRRKVAGLILGMGGAAAVIFTGASPLHVHSDMLGDVLVLLCACATAVYMVWFKQLIARYKITTVLRWVYCAAAVMTLPFGVDGIIRTDYAAMDGRIIFAVLFVVTMPTYLPNLLLNYALKYVQPTVTSVYAYLQPVLAILVSVAMGLDTLHADTILSGLVLFSGVALVLSTYAARSKPLSGTAG